MKNFKGKAIYCPSGKAGEYAYWACNFYVGCSNGCTYCYCKKGILAGVMGQDKPQLKKCFKDEKHALDVFKKELMQNLSELQRHGLFFSFTTDPLLPETTLLTQLAAKFCLINDVPVKFLTKRVDWHVDELIKELTKNGTIWNYEPKKHLLAFGFTLTGHDELESNASTNTERIEAMKKLHDAGFKTFASIEPIIDFKSSLEMIVKTAQYCDLYKIGLQSGIRYNKDNLNEFIKDVLCVFNDYYKNYCKYTCRSFKGFDNPFCRGCNFLGEKHKIYFKDSLLKQAGIKREDLPENCVGRDYNMFEL